MNNITGNDLLFSLAAQVYLGLKKEKVRSTKCDFLQKLSQVIL